MARWMRMTPGRAAGAGKARPSPPRSLRGAFHGTRCAGFLRYLIQVLGAETGRPAVICDGIPLKKATSRPSGSISSYAAAASEPRSSSTPHSSAGSPVLPDANPCPVTCTANYALKIAAGYVLHPSHDNESYYFLLQP